MSRHFVKEVESNNAWGGTGFDPVTSLRREVDSNRLTLLRSQPLNDIADVDAAEDLLIFVYDELQSNGTDGREICNRDEIRLAISAMSAVMQRIGLPIDLPFRDFESFRSYWRRQGCANSWQARRDLVDGLLAERIDQVVAMQGRAEMGAVIDSVSPHDALGWPMVDAEIQAMRDEFRDAVTVQNCRAVGLHAVAVLEAVSAVAYEHARHGEDDDEPAITNTKVRLGRVIEVELSGSGNVELRRLARSAIEAAQRVKHAGGPTRRDAGIVADATLLVANIMRRLVADLPAAP